MDRSTQDAPGAATAAGTGGRRRGKPRDAEATRRRILAAARREFARNGLGGARIDRIASRAEANKRMIYHYFGGKEALFTAVVEEAYADIRRAEAKLDLDALEPEAALDALVTFTWRYHLKNPEFLTLVNSENLHRARHLKKSERIREFYPAFVGRMARIVERGVAKGVFRPGLDPVQLNITLAAISYYYLTNRFTGAIVYARDLMAPEMLEARLALNLETMRRLLAA
jgi:AcrR family transcriptional regulator